jgi:hypothetical protein
MCQLGVTFRRLDYLKFAKGLCVASQFLVSKVTNGLMFSSQSIMEAYSEDVRDDVVVWCWYVISDKWKLL